MKAICFGCKYFLNYYVKRSTYFEPLKDGFCVNCNVKAKQSRSKFKLREECEYWEPLEDEQEKSNKQIIRVLRDMEEHLVEIAILLRMNNIL